MREDDVAVTLLRDQYFQTLEALREEHNEHDKLERRAQQAVSASYQSYERLNAHRARARSLRAAFAALTGEELDIEMAKMEDRNAERGIYTLEKKERSTLTKGRRTERPDYIQDGSVVQTRDARGAVAE